jgi:hypothetical protein
VGTLSAQTYSGGSGTEQDPYLISSKADMETLGTSVKEGISYGKYFLLTNDLTGSNLLTTSVGYSAGQPFRGIFDGGGHEIEVNSTDGVFGYLSGATIQNLGVKGTTTSGGICEFAENSIIIYCYNLATVTDGHSAGGICGRASSTTISNCYNLGDISFSSSFSSNVYTGGICGLVSSGSISNCYNTGIVYAYSSNSYSSYAYAGGICGYNDSNSKISNCFTANTTITGKSAAGRIVGYNNGENITNCYALSTITVNGSTIEGAPASSSKDGKSQSLASFQSQSWIEEILQWDFNSVWKMSSNESTANGLPIFKNQQEIPNNIEILIVNKTEKIKIYTIPNGIAVETKDTASVSVFNISGQKVYQSVINGSAEIHLNKGIYIVKANNESQKIIIK